MAGAPGLVSASLGGSFDEPIHPWKLAKLCVDPFLCVH